MVEISKASLRVQWSSGEYRRSHAQRRNLISWILMAALSLESAFGAAAFPWTTATFGPLSLSLPLPLSLPLAPLRPGTTGGATGSPPRTPQAGALGACATGGACATRLARSAARSSLGADGLAGSGASGAGAAAGG